MEDSLRQSFTQVVQGKKPLNSLDQLFSNLQSLSETDKDIILDTIWYIETTFQDDLNTEYRTRLASIVKYIFSKKIIDIKQFKTRLEVSLLAAAGLVEAAAPAPAAEADDGVFKGADVGVASG